MGYVGFASLVKICYALFYVLCIEFWLLDGSIELNER